MQHVQAARLQEADPGERALERARDLGDAVVHFGPVRVDADLHRADAELADAVGLPLAEEDGVGLELDVEAELARVAEELEEILAQEQLAAAEDQKERARRRELIEHALDFGGGQLAVVVVIEVAVHAALVAAVGEIELHREGHALFERAIPHHLHQRAHARTSSGRA